MAQRTNLTVIWFLILPGLIKSAPVYGSPRIFWGFAGDFIESIPFLPIEINIPDVLSSMFNAMGSAFSYMLGLLPFSTSPSRPPKLAELDLMVKALAFDTLLGV